MSQLDLSVAAGVSSRHISFLETGRSQPSIEMVLLLCEVLDVPMRDRNDLVMAAGFDPQYPEPELDELLGGSIGVALDVMIDHHEPYPMLVFDRFYDLVRINSGGEMLLALAGIEDGESANLVKIVFDESIRPMFDNWEAVAGQILRRVQRESLDRPADERMAALLSELLATPGVPDDWRAPDPTAGTEPVLPFRLTVGDAQLSLLATVTRFSAPNNITLDELQIESFLPLDEATRDFFAAR